MSSDKYLSGILLASPASAVLGNKCVPFACSFCSALIAFHYSNGVVEHDSKRVSWQECITSRKLMWIYSGVMDAQWFSNLPFNCNVFWL